MRTLLYFMIGFIITFVFVFASQAQSFADTQLGKDIADTRLKRKNCSGLATDLNCYADSLKAISQKQSLAEKINEGVRRKGYYYRGQNITVDTFDTESCETVRDSLQNENLNQSKQSANMSELCISDRAKPEERFKTITVMGEVSEEYYTPLKLSFLTDNEKNLVNDTRNIVYADLAQMAILWVLPTSFTNINKKQVREEGIAGSYAKNIKAGPHKDADGKFFNYFAHPYVGAAYYSIVRNQGFSKMESFGYAVMMSTFFWEFGLEAIYERPSIQDLIITPIIGAILGEAFYQWGLDIKANAGYALGSKTFGSILLFFFNPAEGISNLINKGLGKKVIQNAKADLVISKKREPLRPGIQHNYINVRLNFQFD